MPGRSHASVPVSASSCLGRNPIGATRGSLIDPGRMISWWRRSSARCEVKWCSLPDISESEQASNQRTRSGVGREPASLVQGHAERWAHPPEKCELPGGPVGCFAHLRAGDGSI